jgi:hypothetical protein
VVDEQGRILEGRRYSHNEPGIRALCVRLLRLRAALVAIERPGGLLIERLLDAGLAVVAVHPNQVKAIRPRYSAAGGKSDSFDSFVLAELARTDSHRFRVLEPDSDRTKALRAMTRARDGLVRTRLGLAYQLRDQLACFWPGASKVFWSVDWQIALAFLKRYPHNAASPLETAAFYKDREGIVHLKGGVTGGVGPVIFALPAGYRPAPGKVLVFSAACNCSYSSISVPTGEVEIEGTGFGADGAVVVLQDVLFSLDGITFRAGS